MKHIFTVNKNLIIPIIAAFISFMSCSKEDDTQQVGVDQEDALEFSKTIPIGHNSWVPNNIIKDNSIISDTGIHNWSSMDDVIHTYVKTGGGKLNVGFKIKSSGDSDIRVTIGKVSKEISITNSEYKTEDVGIFDVEEGYQLIKIEGLAKSSTFIADISELHLGGSAVDSGVNFVPESNYHFGRRGPSVHMSYEEPQGEDINWFYNEVTVPEGNAKIGSFFMATGHSNGYFGMQVNSETERRVLFSIWSAYETDDPNQIPDDFKVITLGHGEGVTVQPFGNEGSGMQSFIDVDWKEGLTYKFLIKVEPSQEANDATDFTGYFFDPDIGSWKLISSLRKPKTSTYLERPHSFLENFSVNTGYQSRKVHFGNQWIFTKNGDWKEMTTASFTNDATAANGDRLDYAGGAEEEVFFLKNCGFFDDNVSPNTTFSRSPSGTNPDIDFSALPVPEMPETEEVDLIDRSGFSVEDFSSQEDAGGEGNTGRAVDILDGDLETYWHSCWSDCTAEYPHEITIDMGEEFQISGIRFYQRQQLSRAVKDFEIKMSDDNSTFTSLGEFQLENSSNAIDIDFETSETFRYLKFIPKSAHDQSAFAALAELQPYR